MCESAFTPSERTRFETTRPEGKAPTLAPAAPSRRAGRRGCGSPEPFPPPRLPGRSRGDHCPFLSGSWGRLSGLSSAESDRKTRGKVSCCGVRCGREPGTAGRGARRSRTSPPQRFGAELLLILPPFPITDVRQYQIRSAISYPASAPTPTAQRGNSFSLKPTPPKRTPTKTKLNKTPTKNNRTKNITDCSLGLLSPLPHTVKEISVLACIETCRETPTQLSSYFSVQEIKETIITGHSLPVKCFALIKMNMFSWKHFSGVAPFHACPR